MCYSKISQIFDDLTNLGVTIKTIDYKLINKLGYVVNPKTGEVSIPYRSITTPEQFEEFLSNGPSDWCIYNS